MALRARVAAGRLDMQARRVRVAVMGLTAAQARTGMCSSSPWTLSALAKTRAVTQYRWRLAFTGKSIVSLTASLENLISPLSIFCLQAPAGGGAQVGGGERQRRRRRLQAHQRGDAPLHVERLLGEICSAM